MSNKGAIMSEREARDLLGLPKTGGLDKATVDAQFCRVFRTQQAKANSIFNAGERKTAWDTLVLVKEAQKICLNNIGKSTTPTAATNTAVPSAAKWSGRPNTPFLPKRPCHASSGNIPNAGRKLGDVFVHLWLALKNLFGFIVSVPSACVEVKDFISDKLDLIKVAGIPKFVVVLVIIIGFLPILSGCAHAIHQVAMSFVPLIDMFTRFFHNVAELFN
ncbi:MAG: hypothetical protein WCI20_01965 [bacterium]